MIALAIFRNDFYFVYLTYSPTGHAFWSKHPKGARMTSGQAFVQAILTQQKSNTINDGPGPGSGTGHRQWAMAKETAQKVMTHLQHLILRAASTVLLERGSSSVQ